MRDVATADVITMPLHTAIDECAALMSARHIRHLPVVDEGRLSEFVTTGDPPAHRVAESESTLQFMSSYLFEGRGSLRRRAHHRGGDLQRYLSPLHARSASSATNANASADSPLTTLTATPASAPRRPAPAHPPREALAPWGVPPEQDDPHAPPRAPTTTGTSSSMGASIVRGRALERLTPPEPRAVNRRVSATTDRQRARLQRSDAPAPRPVPVATARATGPST
ncbi:MAG: hypothetical protein U0164_18915 [Gemmatimonadaceae bacterium]